MFYVYLLRLSNNALYKGYTADLKRRLGEHVRGNVSSTKHKRPVELVYYEAYKSETDARRRESYLKSGGNAKKVLRQHISESLTTE